MMITKKTLLAVDALMGDSNYNETTMTIHCGTDGEYVGKLFINRKLSLITNKQRTFQAALLKIIEMCEKELESVE